MERIEPREAGDGWVDEAVEGATRCVRDFLSPAPLYQF